MSIESVIGDYTAFVETLTTNLKRIGIETDYDIDHLCYRVTSRGNYEGLRDKLLSFSSGVASTEHNGREFSIFKLKEPLLAGEHTIPLIELPSPADNNPFSEGLEHLEMVISKDFESFCDQHKESLSGKADNRSINPTVYITFKDSGTVKFHPVPLDEVVKLQGDAFTIV